MKTRIFTMLAAVLLSMSAWAQNNEPLKGDVNEDGTVDVADIVAVIEIMKNGGGTGGKVKYYWYVGQTDPKDNSTIVTENGVPGWRKTGTSLTATYYYDSTSNPISDSANAIWYFAIPENSGLGVFDAQNTNYATGTPVSTLTFNNVKYNVWNTGASRKFNAYTIKNK
ncbi:MAG: hypothetical protein IJ605_00005 [Prevotella sp.]|nr:hypothetical protein [Prevotella sp.]